VRLADLTAVLALPQCRVTDACTVWSAGAIRLNIGMQAGIF
jgi:hypothetical protein